MRDCRICILASATDRERFARVTSDAIADLGGDPWPVGP
jgi:hypothetical protein